MTEKTVTVYPTALARHQAVQRALERRMDAFAALTSALEAGDHAAARAANEEFGRVRDAYFHVLNEQWRVEEAS
jgi:hypothetical protein